MSVLKKSQKSRRVMTMAACGALLGGILFGTAQPALAYLTDVDDPMFNHITIALDSTSTVVEKYPKPTPDMENTIASYEKAVQVANTGYIDEYVRVRMDFTEKDIENKTQFSYDGVNFYSVADYKNHLPNGWTYNTSDGYYYYTPIVYSGDWEEISKNLIYDETIGEYFYDAGDQIMENPIITVPLVRFVKTVFDNPKDMRSYGLNVFSESVPFYFGSDYSSAWTNYLTQ